MRCPLPYLVLVLVFASRAAAAAADRSLADARLAQALLGPDRWSVVLRIDNANPRRHYPRVLHALAFELAGLLWFYTDTDGTQSLSLHRGQLGREKANLGPLLAAIDPGFGAWSIVPGPVNAPAASQRPLANGCFIESVAAWRALEHAGVPVQSARLLSFYGSPAGDVPGHTVLAYIADHELRIVDPDRADPGRRWPLFNADDPLALARMVAGPAVAKARFVPLPAQAASVAPSDSAAEPTLRHARSAPQTVGRG